MKHYYTKRVAGSALAVVLAATLVQPLVAEELDTEISSAGATLIIDEYIANSGSAGDVASFLPKEAESTTETEENTATTTQEANSSAENEYFNDIAITKVSGGSEDYVNVRKKPSTESKIVGKIYNNCGATILEETENGWYKMTSGNCTGYVKAEYFVSGNDAQNKALDNGYVIATITDSGIHVRDENSTDSEIVTNVYYNEHYAIKKFDQSGDWVKIKIEAGVSGWVSAQFVDVSVDMDTAITIKEEKAQLKKEREEAARLAAQQAAEEESRRLAEQQASSDTSNTSSSSSSSSSSSYSSSSGSSSSSSSSYSSSGSSGSSSSSSSSSSSGSGGGSAVVAYAKQFLGNPYVYGGASLTNGTDCSGFTMSVYAHFGYSLNRSSYTQVNNGRAVSLSSLQPGDLLFYKYSGATISHVAIYIGGGQIIHASTESTGIIISGMGSPCAARRIIG